MSIKALKDRADVLSDYAYMWHGETLLIQPSKNWE